MFDITLKSVKIFQHNFQFDFTKVQNELTLIMKIKNKAIVGKLIILYQRRLN